MSKPDEMLKEVLQWLGHVYERPLMYGGDANGVEVALWCYHEFWALIVDRGKDLKAIREAQFIESGCQANNFSGHYRTDIHKGCNEVEAANYAVSQWKLIDEKLGLAIPPPPDRLLNLRNR